MNVEKQRGLTEILKFMTAHVVFPEQWTVLRHILKMFPFEIFGLLGSYAAKIVSKLQTYRKILPVQKSP